MDARDTPEVPSWWAKSDEAAEGEHPYELRPTNVLREIALTLPRRTGVSCDGMHVRYVALLPDGTLKIIALLFLIREASGCLPTPAQRPLVYLILTGTGGRRPLCWLPLSRGGGQGLEGRWRRSGKNDTA